MTECMNVLRAPNRVTLFSCNAHQNDQEADLTVRKSSPTYWLTNSETNTDEVQVLEAETASSATYCDSLGKLLNVSDPHYNCI